MTSPLRAVLGQIKAGTGTLAEISRRTDLDPALVRAAVEQLIRLGAVRAQDLTIGCPSSGCSTCSATCTGGGAGVAAGPAAGRRPVLVALTATGERAEEQHGLVPPIR